jgi:hypothetical protein
MRKFVIVPVVSCCSLGVFLVIVSIAATRYDQNHQNYYQKKVADLEAADHLTPLPESPLTKRTPRPTKEPPVRLDLEQLAKYCADPFVKRRDPECSNSNLCRQARISVRDRIIFGPTSYEAKLLRVCSALGQ